jgi:hypothetical protein
MTGCVVWLGALVGAVFVIMTMIRWFEQVTEAVDARWWNKTMLLVFMPFAVWFFPSRTSAGRPTVVPHHEPVRGFGGLPKGGTQEPAPDEQASAEAQVPLAARADAPPPGTPKEFLGMPKIPPKRTGAKSAVDPEKLAKLKQKMREQGMLE